MISRYGDEKFVMLFDYCNLYEPIKNGPDSISYKVNTASFSLTILL